MIQFPEFQFEDLVYAITDKTNGNFGVRFDDDTDLATRRVNLAKALGISPEGVAMSVNGGEDVLIATEVDRGRGIHSRDDSPAVDIMLTDVRDLPLWLHVADCLPIIIFDPGRAVALVHAGWSGTHLGVATKAIRLMNETFGSEPGNLHVLIGPGIRQESYVRPAEVTSQKDHPEWQPFLRQQGDSYAIDVAGYNHQQLRDAGVPETNVFDCGIDTAADDRFFSHDRSARTGEPEGRIAAVVALR